MMLTIHNPKKSRAKKKRAPRKTNKETIVMSKKQKKAKRSKARARKNPSTSKPRKKAKRASSSPARRASRRNPSSSSKGKKHGRPRRRNPDGGKSTTSMLKKIAIAGTAAVLAGAGLTVLATLASPSGNTMAAYYGGGAAGVLGGAILAKKRPEIGLGIAIGSLAVPLVPKAASFAAQLMPSKLAGMGEVGFDNMAGFQTMRGGREPAQLGMGSVAYEGMGEVAYEGMGSVADEIAAGGNPFDS